jgi:hypothetical protein
MEVILYKKAICNFETALGIAFSANSHEEQFWICDSLAEFFRDESGLENVNAHVEQAETHAFDNGYKQGRAIFTQAEVWCRSGPPQGLSPDGRRSTGNPVYWPPM